MQSQIISDNKILEFEDVSIGARPPYETGLEEVDLELKTGELILVTAEKGQPCFLLADAAEGLVEADRGRVIFGGEDWLAMSPDAAADARGRIGRVFEPAGWISNLNVDENITLSQRHHTRRPEAEIYAEAEQLAREFGLPEVPKVRPSLLTSANRRLSEMIRAFLGEPQLIILENPMEGAHTNVLPYLVKVMEGARARGSAVLWIGSDFGTLKPGVLSPDRQYRLKGPRLFSAE